MTKDELDIKRIALGAISSMSKQLYQGKGTIDNG